MTLNEDIYSQERENNNSQTQNPEKLERSLTFPMIVIMGIASIIGSGLFFVPTISVSATGSSAIFSWIFSGIVSLFVTMYFAELNSMYPKMGGIYEFAKQAYNQFTSFLIGWTEWIIGTLTASMLIVSAVQVLIPQSQVNLFGFSFNSVILKLVIGMLILVIFNFITYKGIKTSAKFLMIFGIIQISIIIFTTILLFSSSELSVDKFEPVFLSDDFKVNFMLLIASLLIVSDVFTGAESVFSLSEETKNPEKTIPKAIVLAQIIITILAIFSLLSIILFFGTSNLISPENMLSQEDVNRFGNLSSELFPYVGYLFFGDNGYFLFKILIFIGIIGSSAEWIVSSPRLLLAMSRDDVFIPQLNKIHKKNKTPYRAIIFQTIIMSIFLLIGISRSGFETLIQILMPLAIFTIIATILIVPLFRIKKPNVPRPYAAPFGKIGPIVVSIIFLMILIAWFNVEESSAVLLGVSFSFLLFGFPFYLTMQLYLNKKIIINLEGFFSNFNYILEPITIPKRLRKEVIEIIGDFTNKTVLDYGCGTGVLTKEILKTNDSVHLLSTDQSSRNVELTKKRIKKLNKNTVLIWQDKDLTSRIDPNIKNIDSLISFNTLGYIRDIDSFLDEMSEKISQFGRFCFIEYCDLFGFLPNSPVFNDLDELKEKFAKHGFIVRVAKKPGFLWNYLIVYGFKTEREASSDFVMI